MTPGYSMDPNKVFVVTGVGNPSGLKPKDVDIKTEAHYLIADTENDAIREVLKVNPSFVPMGASTLSELKKFVIEMEAVRLGIKQPLNAMALAC
jgi:hypothetical protein